jgi:hypothetical protein
MRSMVVKYYLETVGIKGKVKDDGKNAWFLV